MVELLIIVGLIGVLVTLLTPSLESARAQARSAQCQSNLHQLGISLLTYVNENKGWLFPVGPDDKNGRPTTLGSNKPPNERWPMLVPAFQIHAPNPLPFNPKNYTRDSEAAQFPAEPFTPPILRCPSDPDAAEAHSYVLNQHLADKRITFGKKGFGGLSSVEVVVAGEKVSAERDYYMERPDFDRVVEKYRHGIKYGSNYLFYDGHVSTAAPQEALNGMDPWDIPIPDKTTTQPSS